MSASNPVRAIYRALLQIPAGRAIRRMLAVGLPAELAPALNYLSRPVIEPADQPILMQIERLRTAILARTDQPPKAFMSPEPQPAEKEATADVAKGAFEPSSWEWIANRACVNFYWGGFLYLCAKHKSAEHILELGGCAGISACYLGAGNPDAQLITTEGSPELAVIAGSNLRAINPQARVVNALFEHALDEWLPKLSGALDIVHIDGQHERASTLHYFSRLKSHLRPGALVIFDDIHWSKDMSEAWREIATAQGVSQSINLGRYGIVVWSGAAVPARVHDFSRYARNWRLENRPRIRS
jgi:predicted O-methyltransferase YrrM